MIIGSIIFSYDGMICYRLKLDTRSDREYHSVIKFPVLPTSRLWQNGHHFADDMLKPTSAYGSCWIFVKMSLISIPKCWIDYKSAYAQVMARCLAGRKYNQSQSWYRSVRAHGVTRPKWIPVRKPSAGQGTHIYMWCGLCEGAPRRSFNFKMWL